MICAAALLAFAAPSFAQVGTALKVADFALDLRNSEADSAAYVRAAAELDRQIDQFIEQQISAPEMSGLLDARLDAFELRRQARAVSGVALRVQACQDVPSGCGTEPDELDSILRRTASEIAASPPGAATLGLLERARALHMAVLDLRTAPDAERRFIAASYDRYYAALGSAAPGSASETARSDLIRTLSEIIDVPVLDIQLGHHRDLIPLIDEVLDEQGGAILLAGLRSHFDADVRFMALQTGLGAASIQFNCRLNRDRPGILDGRVSPLRLPISLAELIEEDASLKFPGQPVTGADYELLWLSAAIARVGDDADIVAAETAMIDDANQQFALPYAGSFYTDRAADEPATLPYKGARTDADLLRLMGVYPRSPGPCMLTDGIVLINAVDSLTDLEDTLRRTWDDTRRVLVALVELERLRGLATTLSQ